MPNSNTKTIPVMFRIPIEVYKVIERRVGKHPRHDKVSEYLRERAIYDITRKHSYRRGNE